MIVDFTSSSFTNLGSQDVTGAVTVTKNTIGAVVGSRSIAYFRATDTGSLDLSDFHRIAGAIEFDNTPGVLNAVLFTYDGVYYWANCWQAGNLLPIDKTLPVVRQVAIRETGSLFVRFLEDVSGTTAGYTILNAATPVTKTGVTGDAGRSIAISGSFAYGDAVTLAYSGGDTVDNSGNALANFAAVTADNLLPNPAAVLTWPYLSSGDIAVVHDGVKNVTGPMYDWTPKARSAEQVSSGQKVRFRNFDTVSDQQKRVVMTTLTTPTFNTGYGVQLAGGGASMLIDATASQSAAKGTGEDWWEIWHMGTHFKLYRSSDGVTFSQIMDSDELLTPIANVPYYVAVFIATTLSGIQDVQILAQ